MGSPFKIVVRTIIVKIPEERWNTLHADKLEDMMDKIDDTIDSMQEAIETKLKESVDDSLIVVIED